MPQHYQHSKPLLNLGPSTTAHVDYAKYLLGILVLLKFVLVSNVIHTSAYSFFKKTKCFLFKENLECFDFLHSWTYNPHTKKKNLILKSDSHLPKKFLFIFFNESPLKMIKKCFLFYLKSSFFSQGI